VDFPRPGGGAPTLLVSDVRVHYSRKRTAWDKR
jgi:hypothetical protein